MSDLNEIVAASHTTAGVVAVLARQASEIVSKPSKGDYPDAGPYLILRNADGSERIEALTITQQPPARKTGLLTLLDRRSFIDYIKLHGIATPIYARIDPAEFTAILNDHTDLSAGYRDFRATLRLGFSDEWKAWTERNGQQKGFQSTEDFAQFLEINALDITAPDPAQFIELALNFQVNQTVNYSKAQRLEDGHVQFAYNQVVDGGGVGAAGTIKMPTSFKIKVPVFRSASEEAPRYECEAKLRYRLSGSKLTIWYEMVRPSKVVEVAFKALWESIALEAGVPVLYGQAA